MPNNFGICVMENFFQFVLYVHIITGTLALFTGLVSIFSKKGSKRHTTFGRFYFWAMTFVFITGILVAGYKYNRFLFLIAFLSYYSVFCGVRSLKLKRLHKNQRPQWYDWLAGFLNGFANLLFVILGFTYLLRTHTNMGGALLSLGFGLGGLYLTYTNIIPFIRKPHKPYHWYISHIGNMMGGYIATFTAFLSTVVTRYDLMNPYIAFALPSLIGIPAIVYWLQKTEKKFNRSVTS